MGPLRVNGIKTLLLKRKFCLHSVFCPKMYNLYIVKVLPTCSTSAAPYLINHLQSHFIYNPPCLLGNPPAPHSTPSVPVDILLVSLVQFSWRLVANNSLAVKRSVYNIGCYKKTLVHHAMSSRKLPVMSSRCTREAFS